MHFSKAVTIAVVVLFSSALAAPAPNAEAEAAPVGEALVPRGFGCPLNRYECDSHCKGLGGGRTGGFCAGTFRTTCTCVKG